MPVALIGQRTGYRGPGDVVSGAAVWYGLRGYNNAYATGSNKAINVRRASDSTAQDILILGNGMLDIATANTFAGTDATATASATASTTIALTGASSTPHAGSTITGTGVTQPCYVVSVGSFTGGAGNIVVNAAQTLAAVSITLQYGLFVTEIYDQSGNGRHATQATSATQPQLLPTVQSGLPGIKFNGSQYLIGTATAAAIVQPVTISWVANRTSAISTGYVLSAYNGSVGACLGFNGSAAQIVMYAGSVVTASATTGTAHSAQGVFNGASSTISIDGVATTGVNPSTNAGNAKMGFGAHVNAASPLDLGYAFEAGEWPSAFTVGNLTSMHTNQSAYWGTP